MVKNISTHKERLCYLLPAMLSLYMYLSASEQEKSEFETVNMIKYLPVLEERLWQIQQDTEASESL